MTHDRRKHIHLLITVDRWRDGTLSVDVDDIRLYIILSRTRDVLAGEVSFFVNRWKESGVFSVGPLVVSKLVPINIDTWRPSNSRWWWDTAVKAVMEEEV